MLLVFFSFFVALIVCVCVCACVRVCMRACVGGGVEEAVFSTAQRIGITTPQKTKY